MPLTLTSEDEVPMNGFERHGINHSSASALNQWAEAPDAWISQYLFGNKGKFSPAAKSGVLVEEAVVNVIARGWTADAAMAYALDAYRRFTAIGATETDLKRGDGMCEMIRLALAELAPYGTPEFDKDGITGDVRQKKVEVICRGDGFSIPIIGFVDFDFPKVGTLIDLKTTTKMPSEMSGPHLRQQAIYQQAFGNRAVKFLYVTPKKAQIFAPDGHKGVLADIKTILNRQEKFLRLGDRDFLKEIVPVSLDSFYWNGNQDVRKELYGI